VSSSTAAARWKPEKPGKERGQPCPREPEPGPGTRVEVLSPSNTEAEMNERKRLYFENSASEFWLCGLLGEMSFFDLGGQIPQSRLCPDFPKRVVID